MPAEPRGPAWLRNLIANHLFESPSEVFFKNDRTRQQTITDVDFLPLEELSFLQWLEIEPKSAVTDAGLALIAKAKNLRLLRLRTVPLTNATLVELGSLPRLEHIELYSVAMSGDGFFALQRNANLRGIHLYGTIEGLHIAMQHLKHLPNLKSIFFSLHNDPEWTDLAVDDGAGFPKLTSLNLNGRFTDRAYDQLRQFPCLDWLSLTPSNSPDDNMQKVAQIPKLRELYLYTREISDRGIDALKDATQLERLTVYFANHLTTASLESLVNLPNLQQIDIRDAPFDDTALKPLSQMKALKRVHIVDARFSANAVKEFTAGHSQLDIDIISVKGSNE